MIVRSKIVKLPANKGKHNTSNCFSKNIDEVPSGFPSPVWHCGLNTYPPQRVKTDRAVKKFCKSSGQRKGKEPANATKCKWLSIIFCNGCARCACGFESRSAAAPKNILNIKNENVNEKPTIKTRCAEVGQRAQPATPYG